MTDLDLYDAFGAKSEGEPGRPVAIDRLRVWPRVDISNGMVRVAGRPREAEVPDDALRRFLLLRNGGIREVRDFVLAYGPLCLCPIHGMPTADNDYCHESATADGRRVYNGTIQCRRFFAPATPPVSEGDRIFVPAEKAFEKKGSEGESTFVGVPVGEPLDAYTRLAARAFSLFQCAYKMRQGQKPRPEEFPVDNQMLRYCDYDPATWLLEHTRWWAWACGLGIDVEPGKPVRLGFTAPQPNPLFAVIALQIVGALNGAGGFAICAECGTPYTARRRPGPRETNYCSNCGIRAAWRKAARRYRKKTVKKRRASIGRKSR